MPRAGIMVLALLCSTGARAAAIDCIQDGGQMQCTDPVIKSERVSLCDVAGTFRWLEIIKTNCEWGSVGTSVSDIAAKVNCYENGVTGCSGTNTQFPGWSSPGQTYSSWLCGTINTTTRNGYPMNQFAVMTSSTITKDDQGNCTVSSSFPYTVVAHFSRELECPAGWSTATRPNGDYRCYRCPDNATWNGTDCVCKAGFVKDPTTRQCIRACPNDQACDDGNVCNGTETCVAGLCQPGTQQTCNDDIQCTVDTCDASVNQCTYRVDPLLCRCEQLEPPEIATTFKKELSLLDVECPRIGGKVGASIELSAEPKFKGPACATGCEASTSTDAKFVLKGSLCGPTYTGTATGSYQSKAAHCVTCGTQCLESCGPGACVESGGGGATSLALERNFQWFKKEVTEGLFKGVAIDCSASLAGSLTTTMSYQGTEDQGSCKSCPDCSKLTSTLTGAASGQVGCKFTGPGKHKSSACLGCGELMIKETGGATGQWGACGNESCPMVRVDVEGAMKAKFSFKFGWWEVQGECATKLTACSEANLCATCTCKDCQEVKSDKASCKVTSEVSL